MVEPTHFETYARQIGISPQGSGYEKKYLRPLPPPSHDSTRQNLGPFAASLWKTFSGLHFRKPSKFKGANLRVFFRDDSQDLILSVMILSVAQSVKLQTSNLKKKQTLF